MKQRFQYSVIQTALNDIEVEDIGNCALKLALGDVDFYLIVSTELGDTKVIEFGPVVTETGLIFGNEKMPFKYTSKTFSYKEKKCIKAIESFLKITYSPLLALTAEVVAIDKEEARIVLENLNFEDI